MTNSARTWVVACHTEGSQAGCHTDMVNKIDPEDCSVTCLFCSDTPWRTHHSLFLQMSLQTSCVTWSMDFWKQVRLNADNSYQIMFPTLKWVNLWMRMFFILHLKALFISQLAVCVSFWTLSPFPSSWMPIFVWFVCNILKYQWLHYYF